MKTVNVASVPQRSPFRYPGGKTWFVPHKDNKEVVFFIDPPYTAGGKKAGSRLYTHCELDHETLFAVCEKIQGDCIMTYDNAEEVRELARKHGLAVKPISMKNTHHAAMTELVIGRDLEWMTGIDRVLEERAAYKSLPIDS